MTAPIVVVGGGLAAGSAVTELREAGYDGDVVVLTEEHHVPYERPPLSKAVLRGEEPVVSAYVHPASWYAEHDVVVRAGSRVTAIDPVGQTVSSEVGETPFSSLLLATGARVRTLPIEPTAQVAVHHLRSIDDAAALRDRLGPDHHLLVLGAGWIGMEAAASARQLGTTVTVVDPAEQPLLAVLGPEVGARFAAVHRDRGVDLRTRTTLDHLSGGEAVLSDDSTVPVDAVLVGVGVVPNTELAEAAGLRVDNGVLVDPHLRTDHPAIYAAGDVANAQHPVLGERIRVEHWQNARGQGRTAARALLGQPATYEDLPYFFTDQFDLGMEYFGHLGSGGFDDLRLEDGADGAFAAFWSLRGRLVAAMHVNQWDRSDELRDRVRDGH